MAGKRLLYTILAAGIALRIFHYVDNRSLWEDEVFLASSLIHMDFIELLTKPLDYMQRAPVGFLMLERLVVVLWNGKEMALRLVPLLSGIIALVLFVGVGRFFLKSGTALLVTVALFAFSPPLVYHSVEAKQYGTELLATVLSLRLHIWFHRANRLPQLLAWGAAGAIILWFSFSSLFVLFGIAGAVCMTDIYRKDWKMFFWHLLPFGLWFLSFAIEYVLLISRYPQENWLQQFWRNREAFMPFPISSLTDLGWLFRQIYALVRYPMGLTWLELDYTVPYSLAERILARFPFVAIGTGLFGLWRIYRLEKATLLAWSVPVVLTLAASAFEFYPVRERMTVFLAPYFLLVIGKGIEQMQGFAWKTAWKNGVIFVIVGAPASNSFAQVVNTDYFGDYKKSRQREAMQFVARNYRTGDVVYVYWNNLPSYRYYQQVYGLRFNVVYGSDVRAKSSDFTSYFINMEPELARLEGHSRVWYFYKPYDGMKLGDIENEPAWYYRSKGAYNTVLSHMARFGKVGRVFPANGLATDVKVVLFENTPNRLHP